MHSLSKKELVLELEVGLNVLKTNFHAFCLRTDFSATSDPQLLHFLTHLVKANHVKLTAHVDPLRTDAEDADALQTPLCVNDAGRHGGR